MSARRTVKVAVIGSGLAGLTAAYRLARTPFLENVEFEVHLFEKVRILVPRAFWWLRRCPLFLMPPTPTSRQCLPFAAVVAPTWTLNFDCRATSGFIGAWPGLVERGWVVVFESMVAWRREEIEVHRCTGKEATYGDLRC